MPIKNVILEFLAMINSNYGLSVTSDKMKATENTPGLN